MSKKMRKTTRRMAAAAPVAAVLLLAATPAALAVEPGLVTGAKNLLNDATSWLLGLIPAGSAAAIGYHALMKQLSDGAPEAAAVHNRAMRNVLIGGAVGTSAVGLTKAILAYFQ